MSNAPVRVIINADDLGRTVGINEGIFESHRLGVVTSATLMVNYEASSAAAEALPLHPELGVGLHVALTGDAPCLPPSTVPTLVDGAGRFPAKPENLGVLDPDDVRAEVRAQLDRFRELTGRRPTHLDSHHHSHRHPIVCQALIEIARELDIPVRCSSEEVAAALREAGVRSTDHFVERFFAEEATQPVLEQILRSCGPGTTEIMCHPGRVDDELRGGSSYTVDRERELEILCSPETFDLMHELDIERIDFAAI